MKRATLSYPVLLAIAAIAHSLPAAAQMGPPAPKSEVAQKIEAALASDIRTPQERARDTPERKPVQTLEFFGLTPSMKVVELFPAGGWYTKCSRRCWLRKASSTSQSARHGSNRASRNGSWIRWRH
jgi:hypothetical protein